MTAKCSREGCGKTVYPLEELKCLDKVWHKQCFKCFTCGMVLSMKTYKGFEKNPYCQSHYPKILPTAVTQTPEMLTAKANTEFQSQAQYHSQYEKTKGQKINISDDPELKRCMQNTKNQSQVEYHKEQEKKKQQDSTRPEQDLSSNVQPAEQRKIGNIADYNPPANESTPANENGKASTQKPSDAQQKQTSQPNSNKNANSGGGFVVRALYDYVAADKDEVSFNENDVIVNCQMVDEGWMTGTVQRTLMWGMLPANYVEKVNQPKGQFKIK